MQKKAKDLFRFKVPPPEKVKLDNSPVSEILLKAQNNESVHRNYFRELDQLYKKAGHDEFQPPFLRGLQSWMKYDENHEYANVGLNFCARYLSTLATGAAVNTHPLIISTITFLLERTSSVANVRFRICQFIGTLLDHMPLEMGLKDDVCSKITKYMLQRLIDPSAAVRVQTINALQRLQQKNDANDAVTQAYIFHLANDPSSAVRIATLTSIGPSQCTIPSIMDRLQDVEEEVRRHTYQKLCKYPVKMLKVFERVTILERGFNDKSASLREMVSNVLLPQWLQSYGGIYVALIAALKIDGDERELKQFVAVTKQSLFVLFKNESIEKLIKPLPTESEEGGYSKCVPFGRLTVECAVYWAALVEHFQSADVGDDDESQNKFICELGTYCEYLKGLFRHMDTIEKEEEEEWTAIENRYKCLILMDILLVLDVGDEIGRNKLKFLFVDVLSMKAVGESIVQKLVLAMERVMTDSSERLEFFADLLHRMTDPLEFPIDLSRDSIGSILCNVTDPEIKMQVTQLRLKILGLRELQMTKTPSKDYQTIHAINEKLIAHEEELMGLCHQIDPAEAYTHSRKMTNALTIQCLQVFFHAIASRHTRTLTPSVCQLCTDFVLIRTGSDDLTVRDWALRCDVACSMQYEQRAKDTYFRMKQQLIDTSIASIWVTATKGMFELVDRYGFSYFKMENESCDDSSSEQSEFLQMFQVILDDCKDVAILKAAVIGFCRLVLSGRLPPDGIVKKMLLTFFDPTCKPEVNQVLAIFFETISRRRLQKYLAAGLLPSLHDIWTAKPECHLRNVNAEEIVKFVIKSTVPADRNAKPTDRNIHNIIALRILDAMNMHHVNQDIMKLLSNELVTLHVSTDNTDMFIRLRVLFREKTRNLLRHSLHAQVKKNLQKFQKTFLKKTQSSEADTETIVID